MDSLKEKKSPGPGYKWFLGSFLGGLILAGGGTLLSPGTALLALAHFPIGIMIAITGDTRASSVMEQWTPIVLGYLVYAALITIGSFKKSWVVLGILIVLLLLNVSGCRRLWNDLGSIH